MSQYRPANLRARRVHPRKVGRTGPAGVMELPAFEAADAGIPGQDVKMNIRIHHHQHEIIDLVVGERVCESPLDLPRDLAQLGERPWGQHGKRPCGLRANEHEGPERRLLGAQQDHPLVELLDECLRISERFHRGVDFARRSSYSGKPFSLGLLYHRETDFSPAKTGAARAMVHGPPGTDGLLEASPGMRL